MMSTQGTTGGGMMTRKRAKIQRKEENAKKVKQHTRTSYIVVDQRLGKVKTEVKEEPSLAEEVEEREIIVKEEVHVPMETEEVLEGVPVESDTENLVDIVVKLEVDTAATEESVVLMEQGTTKAVEEQVDDGDGEIGVDLEGQSVEEVAETGSNSVENAIGTMEEESGVGGAAENDELQRITEDYRAMNRLAEERAAKIKHLEKLLKDKDSEGGDGKTGVPESSMEGEVASVSEANMDKDDNRSSNLSMKAGTNLHSNCVPLEVFQRFEREAEKRFRALEEMVQELQQQKVRNSGDVQQMTENQDGGGGHLEPAVVTEASQEFTDERREASDGNIEIIDIEVPTSAISLLTHDALLTSPNASNAADFEDDGTVTLFPNTSEGNPSSNLSIQLEDVDSPIDIEEEMHIPPSPVNLSAGAGTDGIQETISGINGGVSVADALNGGNSADLEDDRTEASDDEALEPEVIFKVEKGDFWKNGENGAAIKFQPNISTLKAPAVLRIEEGDYHHCDYEEMKIDSWIAIQSFLEKYGHLFRELVYSTFWEQQFGYTEATFVSWLGMMPNLEKIRLVRGHFKYSISDWLYYPFPVLQKMKHLQVSESWTVTLIRAALLANTHITSLGLCTKNFDFTRISLPQLNWLSLPGLTTFKDPIWKTLHKLKAPLLKTLVISQVFDFSVLRSALLKFRASLETLQLRFRFPKDQIYINPLPKMVRLHTVVINIGVDDVVPFSRILQFVWKSYTLKDLVLRLEQGGDPDQLFGSRTNIGIRIHLKTELVSKLWTILHNLRKVKIIIGYGNGAMRFEFNRNIAGGS